MFRALAELQAGSKQARPRKSDHLRKAATQLEEENETLKNKLRELEVLHAEAHAEKEKMQAHMPVSRARGLGMNSSRKSPKRRGAPEVTTQHSDSSDGDIPMTRDLASAQDQLEHLRQELRAERRRAEENDKKFNKARDELEVVNEKMNKMAEKQQQKMEEKKKEMNERSGIGSPRHGSPVGSPRGRPQAAQDNTPSSPRNGAEKPLSPRQKFLHMDMEDNTGQMLTTEDDTPPPTPSSVKVELANLKEERDRYKRQADSASLRSDKLTAELATKEQLHADERDGPAPALVPEPVRYELYSISST